MNLSFNILKIAYSFPCSQYCLHSTSAIGPKPQRAIPGSGIFSQKSQNRIVNNRACFLSPPTDRTVYTCNNRQSSAFYAQLLRPESQITSNNGSSGSYRRLKHQTHQTLEFIVKLQEKYVLYNILTPFQIPIQTNPRRVQTLCKTRADKLFWYGKRICPEICQVSISSQMQVF